MTSKRGSRAALSVFLSIAACSGQEGTGRGARTAPTHEDGRSGFSWSLSERLAPEGDAAYREQLLIGLHTGIETGQYICSFYNTVNAITNSLLRGLPISDLLGEAQSYASMPKLDRSTATTIAW